MSSAPPPFVSRPFHSPLHNPHVHTIRSLTGSDVYPPSPCPSPVTPEKRYSRQNILIFRTAAGEERRLSSLTHHADDPPSPQKSHTQQSPPSSKPALKPRISSVTESSQASPHHSHEDLDQLPIHTTILPDVHAIPPGPVYGDDDNDSIYSHASAINLDDMPDQDHSQFPYDQHPQGNRKRLGTQRQSLATSFARTRKPKDHTALVLARPEMQPHNRSVCLMERCVRALTEVLDMNLLYAGVAVDKFHSFSSLYTDEECQVIADLLKESSARLRNEAPTPWRSPIRNPKHIVIKGCPPQNHSTNQVANLFRSQFSKGQNKTMSSDTLIRSVVFGSHVIPGVQSAESILLRMAGEYQREEINRKANRAERIDIPVSFAMTLTAALAAFARLECHVSYRRYRSRSAANRRSSPRALIMVKTRYDGHRLSFAVTLHGDSPCTVLFRRPRLFSLRKIDDYTTLVTEAKDILIEFGREVTGNKNYY